MVKYSCVYAVVQTNFFRKGGSAVMKEISFNTNNINTNAFNYISHLCYIIETLKVCFVKLKATLTLNIFSHTLLLLHFFAIICLYSG